MKNADPMFSRQLPLAVRLRDEATFSNFHGNHNAAALARLQVALDERQPVIVLAGDTGSGKSHLLQAASQQDGSLWMDLEELRAMTPAVLEGLGASDRVCLDNLDVVCGQPDWEEGLFHLLNRLQDNGTMLVVGTRRVPAELPVALADLRSRLAAGILLQLSRPQDSDRLAIIKTRAERRGLELSDEVAHYILRRADRHTGALLAVLRVLDDASLSSQRRLTVPFVKAVMAW